MSRWKLTLLAIPIFLGGFALRAQLPKLPGYEPYNPTKLEWAALELQARYGIPVSDMVSIQYLATDDDRDGTGITCVLTYNPEVSTAALTAYRKMAQVAFDGYTKSPRWSWLKLHFKEQRLAPKK